MLEPGGNRIELMGDPGYMIFDPAWRTVVWKGSEGFDGSRNTGLHCLGKLAVGRCRRK
jgi:hypothetical protein